MVQSFNLPAAAGALRVLRNKSLAVPHLFVKSLANINWAVLKELGISGVVLDKDNTVTEPYAREIFPPLRPAVEDCLRVFGRTRVVVFSNSAGSSDDVGFESAAALENAIGIDVLRHGEKKPNGVKALRVRFDDLRRVAFIGDRLLTDVVFGNTYGCFTIHTRAFSFERDNVFAKMIRPIEERVVRGWVARGVQPPLHAFVGQDQIKRVVIR